MIVVLTHYDDPIKIQRKVLGLQELKGFLQVRGVRIPAWVTAAGQMIVRLRARAKGVGFRD